MLAGPLTHGKVSPLPSLPDKFKLQLIMCSSARFALNFKDLPYQTEWVEYPDVAPKLKNLGVSPNAEGFQYTIPAITISSGKQSESIMESKAIAQAIEAKYADQGPSLRLDSDVLPKVEEVVGKIAMPLVGVWMPKIPRALLNPPSAEYFERTRAERFGMPLEQLAKEKGGDKGWEEAKPGMEEAAKLLKNNGDGPYFEGNTPGYADGVFAGMMRFLKRVDEQDFERFLGFDDVFKKFYDACEKWLERDDH